MSESILDHGFIPEEHAPDPVIGHGDPTPPGKVAIWLFLASEVMFFIGALGSYIIFRSGNAKIFAEHALVLSKTLAGINTLVLIFSSLTMALSVDAAQKGDRKRATICLFLTLLCAFGFMGIKAKEYYDKFTHHTVVAKDAADGKIYVYDGHVHEHTPDGLVLVGHRMLMPEEGPFDIHWMSEHGVEAVAKMQASQGIVGPHGGNDKSVDRPVADTEGHEHPSFKIPTANIAQDLTYGPWKNMFFACYFTLTGVHGLHVLGGMVPLTILLVQSMRGKLFPAHTEYVGLYWHFVDLVWIFLFPLLYLV